MPRLALKFISIHEFSNMQIRAISNVVSDLGEGPVWDDRTGEVLWTDITGKKFHRTHLNTGLTESFSMPMMIGAIALTHDDSYVAATQTGIAGISRSGELITQNSFLAPDSRMNDGKVDQRGRFLAGSVAIDFSQERGTLYSFDASGKIRPLLERLTLSNGMCWSADGESFFFIDSIPGTLWRYRYDMEKGEISSGEVLIRFDSGDGVPDGMCMSSEGFLIIAFWDGSRVEVFDQNGISQQRIHLEVQRPTSCAFAGFDGEILIVTSASQGIDQSRQPLAGKTIAITGTGLSGAPSHRYG